MSRHPKADAYRKDRELGMTFQQIADKYGVSRQTVAEATSKQVINSDTSLRKDVCIRSFASG